MKKFFLLLFLLPFCIGGIQQQHLAVIAKKQDVSYCASISWSNLTSPDFMLDVDNTVNDLLACTGDTTEAGDVNTAHCTPGTVSLGSGGQAICSANGVIQYDNTGSYVVMSLGEVAGTIWISNVSASISTFVEFGDVTDFISVKINALEKIYIAINDGVAITVSDPIDITSYINTYWVDFQCQWDESRSTGDEATCRIRVQDGTPIWEAWSNSTDVDTFTFSGNGPGADEIDFGGIDNDHGIIIDDIEINNTVPSWEPL